MPLKAYEAMVDGEDVAKHSTMWETLEEACIYVADFCKAAHPPPGTGGRMWGKHRFGSVVLRGETKAEYWRASRGNTSSHSEWVTHIGQNVMRVFVTDDYLAQKEGEVQRTTPTTVGTMREEIERANAKLDEA